jgi:hypothetical protein
MEFISAAVVMVIWGYVVGAAIGTLLAFLWMGALLATEIMIKILKLLQKP